MIGRCPAIASEGDAVVGPMLSAVDCHVDQLVQSGYAALLGPSSSFAAILTLSLTLLIAFYGYQLMFGRMALTVSSVLPRVALIGVVMTFATSWAAYQTVVYDVLTSGPAEVAGYLLGGDGGSAALANRLDLVFMRLTEAATAWGEASKPAGAPNPKQVIPGSLGSGNLGSQLLWLSAMGLVLSSAGLLVIAKILLGVLLAAGPLFVLMALFGPTRALFDGWLRTSVSFALAPLVITVLTAGLLVLLDSTLVEIVVAQRSGVFEMRPVLTLFIATLIFAIMMVLVLRLTASVTAGWQPASSFQWGGAKSRGEADPAPVAAPQPGFSPLFAGSAPQSENASRIAAIVSAASQGIPALPAPAAAGPSAATVRTAIAAVTISAERTPAQPVAGRHLGQTYRQIGAAKKVAAAGGWR